MYHSLTCGENHLCNACELCEHSCVRLCLCICVWFRTEYQSRHSVLVVQRVAPVDPTQQKNTKTHTHTPTQCSLYNSISICADCKTCSNVQHFSNDYLQRTYTYVWLDYISGVVYVETVIIFSTFEHTHKSAHKHIDFTGQNCGKQCDVRRTNDLKDTLSKRLYNLYGHIEST